MIKTTLEFNMLRVKMLSYCVQSLFKYCRLQMPSNVMYCSFLVKRLNYVTFLIIMIWVLCREEAKGVSYLSR